MDGIRKFDLTLPAKLDRDTIGEVLKIVKHEWKLDDVKTKDLSSNGLLNTNVLLYVGDVPTDEDIVIRVIEPEMLHHFREDIEVGIRLINGASLSPKVLCFFENGVCMHYQPGLGFTWDETHLLHQEHIIDAVAHEMAKYHTKKLMEQALECGVTETFAGLDRKWAVKRWAILLQKTDIPRSFIDLVPDREVIYRDIEHLEALLSRLKSPRRFCHMDINPTNIIYNQEQKRAYILDYENPCIYFAFGEVAWYFLTHFNFNQSDYCAHYPNELYRRRFLTKYLNYRRREDGIAGTPTEAEIDVAMRHTDVAFLLMVLRMVIVGFVLESYTPPHAPIDVMSRLITNSWSTYQLSKGPTLDSVQDEHKWEYTFNSF